MKTGRALLVLALFAALACCSSSEAATFPSIFRARYFHVETTDSWAATFFKLPAMVITYPFSLITNTYYYIAH